MSNGSVFPQMKGHIFKRHKKLQMLESWTKLSVRQHSWRQWMDTVLGQDPSSSPHTCIHLSLATFCPTLYSLFQRSSPIIVWRPPTCPFPSRICLAALCVLVIYFFMGIIELSYWHPYFIQHIHRCQNCAGKAQSKNIHSSKRCFTAQKLFLYWKLWSLDWQYLQTKIAVLLCFVIS